MLKGDFIDKLPLLVCNRFARKVLLWLFAPANRRYFSQSDLEVLGPATLPNESGEVRWGLRLCSPPFLALGMWVVVIH